MREIRPSGSEGGVARKRHPYPYQTLREAASRAGIREAFGVRRIPALLGASADGSAELIIAPAFTPTLAPSDGRTGCRGVGAGGGELRTARSSCRGGGTSLRNAVGRPSGTLVT